MSAIDTFGFGAPPLKQSNSEQGACSKRPARAKPATLHELLAQSPLNRLDFEERGVRSPVRKAWEP